MAAENESPAREPATRGRGRGRGGRGGRGRGGGRGGASTAAVTKAATATRGRGGARRGRAKNFTDSRVQAAYERQRDLKATYQAVAHALKPALQELAERSIDELMQNPDLYKDAAEYSPIIAQLQRNLDKKIAQYDSRLERDLQLAEGNLQADNYVTEQEFKNGFDEIEEQFIEAEENRLRILFALHNKGLPCDVRDDQYEYKVISDEHLDQDFGIYHAYQHGHLVPYPSRVEGTEMWRKVRAADAAVAAVAAAAPPAAPTRGRGRGRGGIKRKPQEQPDGVPTPKRSARVYELTPMAPAPAKGLLASAAEVESHPEDTPADDESAQGSPEPANMTNGMSFTSFDRGQGKVLAREKSPPLPKYAADSDEHGVRSYTQRPSKDKGVNNRLLAPRLFWFDDWEIGFRDTSNDSSKGHTRTKRGKYLDTPNSNGMHFDHWCNGYDYSNTTRNDFDQELVKHHGIHPTYGLFLPTSTNDQEEGDPYAMPGKPVVFIANPSGRISHASRSFQRTANHRSAVDAPERLRLGASLRRFCKMQEIDAEDIAVDEFLPSEDELRNKSLGTAMRELESRPDLKATVSDIGEAARAEEVSEIDQAGMAALATLTYATAYVEAQDTTRAAPPTPKPARYDAIRDVFTDAKPAVAPVHEPQNMALNFLAELCKTQNHLPGSAIQPPEPAHPAQYIQPAHHYEQHRAAPIPESDIRGTIRPEHESMFTTFSHLPTDPRLQPTESHYGYSQPHHRDQHPMQHAGPSQYQPAEPTQYPAEPSQYSSEHQYPHEPAPYPPAHDPYGPPLHTRSYPPPQGPPAQDHGYYTQHGGYAVPDPRDNHMAASRPMDPAYDARRSSVYGNETSPYPPQYWPQQPPPGQGAPQGPPAGPSQGYPPPQHSRIPFSSSASAEPLPPLRPPRGRNHSIQEELIHDPAMRQPAQNNPGPYYPPGPSRPFHRGYPQDGLAPLQPVSSERILPNPQQGQSYMTSPNQGYPQMLSPTFANSMGPMGQSPPGTPLGAPSAHRHRSTPSGSSDAGSNRFRKLQPAPIPAHRAWSNKPELKTIPYDHKETGSSAALPSSGPTQIRGWNVNQPRKRSRADKQDRADSLHEREDSR